MASHGSTSLTSSSALLQITASGESWLTGAVSADNKARALCRANYVVHNGGPDPVYVMVHDGGGAYGSTEGLKLPSNETLNLIHTGTLFVHCPTASGGNPIAMSWIVTSS